MADDTISISALERFLATNPDSALQSIVNAAKAAGQSVANMGDIAARVSPEMVERIKQISSAVQAAGVNIANLGDATRDALDSGTELFTNLTRQTYEFLKIQQQASGDTRIFATQAALAFEPMLNLIPEGITGIGNFGQAGRIAGQTITNSFAAISPILKSIMGDAKTEGLGRMFAGADRAYQVQTGLIALAASQGQLNGVITSGTNSFEDIDSVMSDFAETAYVSAAATGQTQAAMMELAQELGTIPGSLSDIVEVGGQTATQLTVVSQVGAAFGRSQTEVAKDLTTMYDKMGTKGTEALESIARMYEVAGNSKLRFEGFSKTVLTIADNFKMLGDNTNAATNVVKAFDTAFKDSKISPEAMQKVIQGMTSGIKEMDRGKQAFISGATGGPGGLAGAFEMELAMQEGRMDEVLQKTMTAMQQQFGGQVLTLKDAASNPAMAGEFYKQVQYLRQVAGIAENDRDAYRILEAMQSGVTSNIVGAAGGDESGASALNEATNRGAAEQARTTSVIIEGNRILERTRMMQANELGQLNTSMSRALGVQGRTIGARTQVAGVRGLNADAGAAGAIAQTMSDEDRLSHTFDVLGDTTIGRYLGNIANTGRSTYDGIARTFEPTPPTVEDLTRAPGGGSGRAPASAASLTAAGATGRSPLEVFEQTGQFPISVEHSDINVNVNLPDFDRTVRQIARSEIQNAGRAQSGQADTGRTR